jgi:beta-lactam-binding protein with PASTA domain
MKASVRGDFLRASVRSFSYSRGFSVGVVFAWRCSNFAHVCLDREQLASNSETDTVTTPRARVRTSLMNHFRMMAVRCLRLSGLGILAAILWASTAVTVSAETLMMPKRDMLSGAAQVVWGVTTLPNHTAAAPTTYSIDFGDGTAPATGNVIDRSYLAVNHTYTSAGTFTATLTVTRATTIETATVDVRVYDPAAISAEQLRGVRVNAAIEDGLRYLWVNQTSRATNFPAGVTTSWSASYPESFSALVVLAFENHGYHLENNDDAPLGLYEKYVVRRGLNFIINELRTFSLTVQPAGNPCVNVEAAPCIGLRQNQQSEGYATSLAILPIAASNALNRHVSEIAGTENMGYVVGKTYGEVLQRLVNAMAFGQGESGFARGGWAYNFNSGNTDGSTIGWNVLALLDAAAAGITVPAFVKTEFTNFAVPYGINSDGTFDYTSDNNAASNNIRNMVKAGVGLQAMFYADIVGLGDARVLAGRNATNARWNANVVGDAYPCTALGNQPHKGCGYAMFNVFKGLKLQGITTLPNVTRPAGPGNIPAGDWYADYVDWLLTNQNAPTTLAGGGWPNLDFSCCDGSSGVNRDVATAALAELILSNVALIAPDPTLFSTVGLAPVSALLPPGGSHTVTATATSAGGAPVPGVTISFRVLDGPNAGATGEGVTNAAGQTTFTYQDGGGAGRDTIQAYIGTIGSNIVEAIWSIGTCDPTPLSVTLSSSMFPLDQGWRGVTINGAPGANVTQVCQDEAPNFENVPAWAIDANGVGTSSVSVRAQRSGTRTAPGNGRVYHIYFTSSSCTGKVTVGVPTVAGGTAGDNGPLFNSVTGAACAVPATPPVTTVPDIIGQPQPTAVATLATASLQVGTISSLNHPTIPPGVVISQFPPAGSNVAASSAVAMTVSTGPSSVPVPNVVGAPQNSAAASITSAGLAIAVTETHSTNVPAGLVMAQSPIAGTHVVPGSSVVLTVSLGVATSTVPNLVGLPLSGAVSAVGAHGLNFGEVELVHSTSVPDGAVISQAPPAATVVPPGSVVNFVISQGPPPIPVPNVVGQTLADAGTTLTGAGFALGSVANVNDPTVPPGVVISQAPGANLTAVPGSGVNLTVSTGPVMVTAPNVVGMGQGAAQTAIVSNGLAVGPIALAFDATVPAGSVIGQAPSGGTSVAQGSAVNLTVSKGPAPINVPNLVGQSQSAATTALTTAGLAVGSISTTHSATIPQGIVMGQAPPAGTPVPAGFSVNLLVSLGPVMVTVPNVVGQPQGTATATVFAAQLSYSVSFAASATVPPGSVISQDPVGGSVVPQATFVNLIVSSGPTIGVVPAVVGLSETAAGTAITNASLTVGAITRVNSPTIPAGQVLSQNPGAGSGVPVGSSVALVVSLGPLMVTVPNVVGATDTVAKQTVFAAHLGYNLTYAPSATVPAHEVISQNPTGGTSVPEGTMVDIVASSGATAALVPHVVGQQQSAAASALTAAGLAVGTVTQASHATLPAGAVISQDPSGGSNAPPGSTVALIVSVGPPVPTAVPNVVGQPRADAEQAVLAAGFALGTITEVNDPAVALGNIVSQTPAGGSTALRGTAIDLVVSLGSFLPGVPASLDLQVSTLVVGSGASVTVTTVVKDGFGTPVTPAPPITYQVIPAPGALGAAPTFANGVFSSSADTRGSYTLRGSVDGTAILAERTIVVLNGAPGAKNANVFVRMATAQAAISKGVANLLAAYKGPGTAADVTAARIALTDALNPVPVTGKQSVLYSSAVAPEKFFLPSLSQVTAAGYPLTAGDVAFGNLITQINAKVLQVTAFYNNLSPDGTVGASDATAQLNTLNAELTALLTQLENVTITPHAVVRYASQINTLMTKTVPLHVHATTKRLVTIAQQYPDPASVPAGVARLKGATEYFIALKGEPGFTTPDAFYGRTRPAFFFLISMFGGSSIQMQLIQKMYGEVMHEVDQMIGVLIAHSILSQFIGTGVGDLLSGASLSFHAPNMPGSAIEGYGFGTSAGDNETWFIGPQAFQAVEDLVDKVKGAFEALHDSFEECVDAVSSGGAGFCNTDGVDNFFDEIKGALTGAQEAYDLIHTQPSHVENGCILNDGGGCQSLVFGSGFPDVNTTRFPSPVIVLHRNWVNGGWGLGIFNFVP